MNNALVFLGIAAAIAVVGGLVVAWFNRDAAGPSSDGVDEFKRIMTALAPEEDPAVGRRADHDGGSR